MSFENRMALAKDVLKLLDAEEIVACVGSYYRARGHGFFSDIMTRRVETTELPLTNCQVCVKGAFLVAYLRRNDKRRSLPEMFARIYKEAEHERNACFANPNSLATGRTINVVLGEEFDAKQLQLIEVAFEGMDLPEECFDLLSDEEIDACKKFAPNEDTNNGVLRAICENIIRNDGTFRPETG